MNKSDSVQLHDFLLRGKFPFLHDHPNEERSRMCVYFSRKGCQIFFSWVNRIFWEIWDFWDFFLRNIWFGQSFLMLLVWPACFYGSLASDDAWPTKIKKKNREFFSCPYFCSTPPKQTRNASSIWMTSSQRVRAKNSFLKLPGKKSQNFLFRQSTTLLCAANSLLTPRSSNHKNIWVSPLSLLLNLSTHTYKVYSLGWLNFLESRLEIFTITKNWANVCWFSYQVSSIQT